MAVSPSTTRGPWLPMDVRSRDDGAGELSAGSRRLELVDAVAGRLGRTLDSDLLSLDRAAALLEVPSGKELAEPLVGPGARDRLRRLATSLLGTGNLRDTADFQRSRRLSLVTMHDVSRLASFAAETGDGSDLADLAFELRLEQQILDSGFNDDFEVAIGRTITERNGGNFKGEREPVERPSIERAAEIIDEAWVQYRFAMSMVIAERYAQAPDPYGWIATSPQAILHRARGVLSRLDVRDANVADLLAIVDGLISGDVWQPQLLTKGPSRPLMSEYLYVLDVRGEQ